MSIRAALLSLVLLSALPAQTAWTHVPLFEARHAHATAYDTARGRLVLFGGQGRPSDTWEWDGTTWTRRTPAVNPPPRYGHAMAFDAVRQRVVLFGGQDPRGGRFADTWEWDGSTWLQATPAAAPPPSAYHGLAYDVARRRTVLLGGNVPRGQTWEWDGTRWTVVTTTANGPQQVPGNQLVYDAGRARVLFVGANALTGTMEPWEWNGLSWSLLPVGAGRPQPRDLHALAYDAARRRVVLFGGFTWQQGMPQWFADTWEYGDAGWTRLATAQPAPSARWGCGLSFDPVRSRVVLSGGAALDGATSDTWEWDGATWQLRAGPDAPPPGVDGNLAFDARRGRIVLHQGGRGANSGWPMVPATTWEFDGVRWRPVASAVPSVRSGFALAYDAVRSRVVLFGGAVYVEQMPAYRNDTHEWNGSAWLPVGGTVPPARADAAMAFDQSRQGLLLHGGIGASGLLGDTWELGAAGWQRLAPVHNPPARERRGMAFDSARGRMVLFLADETSSAAAETWEWDGTDWTQRSPSVMPPPRGRFGLVYDERRARVVLFGGMHSASATAFQDTWEWDGADWRQRNVTTAPAPRATTMAYDTWRGRSVLLGIGDAMSGFGDTWEYGSVHPADFQAFGAGCAGTAGTPALRALGLPWLGDSFTLRAEHLPAGNAALVWLGASRTRWGTLPLPLDLTAAGMPGCFLRVRPDFAVPLLNVNGAGDAAIAVPDDVSLLGASVYAQALVADRAANPLGATTSNGGAALIGGR